MKTGYGVIFALVLTAGVVSRCPAEANQREIHKRIKELQDPTRRDAAINWLAAKCPLDNSRLLNAARNKKTAAYVVRIVSGRGAAAVPALKAVMHCSSQDARIRAIQQLARCGPEGLAVCEDYLSDSKLVRVTIQAMMESEQLSPRQYVLFYDRFVTGTGIRLQDRALAVTMARLAAKAQAWEVLDKSADSFFNENPAISAGGYNMLKEFLAAAGIKHPFPPEFTERLKTVRERLQDFLGKCGLHKVRAKRKRGGEALDEYEFEPLPADDVEAHAWDLYFVVLAIDKDAPYLDFLADCIARKEYNIRTRLKAAAYLFNRVPSKKRLAACHKVMETGDVDAQMFIIRKMNDDYPPEQLVPIYIYYVLKSENIPVETRWRIIYRLTRYVEDLMDIVKFPLKNSGADINWKAVIKMDPEPVRLKIAAYWGLNKKKYALAIANLGPEMKELDAWAREKVINAVNDQDGGGGAGASGISIGDGLDLN